MATYKSVSREQRIEAKGRKHLTRSAGYAKLDELLRERSGGRLKKISKKVLDKEDGMRYNK